MSNGQTSLPVLVMLPGMDGTGDLFAPFVSALGSNITTRIVRYPTDVPISYEGLEFYVRQALPNGGAYVLLGESFSGPLAIRTAAAKPDGLVGLVLCCTFVRNPRPALGLLMPFANMLPLKSVPQWALSAWLLGRYATSQLQAALHDVLSKVTLGVLRARILAIASVAVSAQLKQVEVPIVCLSALHDRVVPPQAAEEIISLSPSTKRVVVDGPHMLLQACPLECAIAIRGFLADIGSRTLRQAQRPE